MTKYQVLFTEKEIQNKVSELAYHIKKTKHEEPPVFICVLNGAFMFFTDLVKQIDDCYIDFIRAKSYTDTTQGEIRILKSIDIDIEGKNVYLVDDIYDSGNTMNRLIKHLNYQKPKSITPVTLFKKHYSNNPDLIYGFELHDEQWLIGYGLDASDGTQRNLTYIKGIQPGD
jgi:hypoxanthine phosphoribosyltransferase